MHRDQIAEWILSLVVDRERAESAVGDFLEEVPERGQLWFWGSVARTALSRLGRSLFETPFRMAVHAATAWAAYIAMGFLLSFAGWIAATLAWGMGYFLAHHTGLELITGLLRLRFDWPAPPSEWLRLVDYLVVWVAAPYRLGHFAARTSRGREVVTWLYLVVIWPILMVFVPFTGRHAKASLTAAPVILTLVLAGMLRESWKVRPAVEIEGAG